MYENTTNFEFCASDDNGIIAYGSDITYKLVKGNFYLSKSNTPHHKIIGLC